MVAWESNTLFLLFFFIFSPYFITFILWTIFQIMYMINIFFYDTKGQIKSEWIYKDIYFQKLPPQIFEGFLKIAVWTNSFWLYLTFTTTYVQNIKKKKMLGKTSYSQVRFYLSIFNFFFDLTNLKFYRYFQSQFLKIFGVGLLKEVLSLGYLPRWFDVLTYIPYVKVRIFWEGQKKISM
jgi:hypothetical protein